MLEITLDMALEVALETTLEMAPGSTPDNSRTWFLGLGVERGWSRLKGDARVGWRRWSRSGTPTGKDVNAVLSAIVIHTGEFNNVGFIPSLLLMPSESDVKIFH